ncbi:hypothetical protein BSKO_06632 [Bryopsis sp. KO-2023]|nr:hypothetical protein BSKO_06632 [Bryopsis sp. KO-2023]
MPPRPFTPLWCSGRKLNGPPEGYGWRKEAQVKRWISQLPEPDECSQPDQSSCNDDPLEEDVGLADVEAKNVEETKLVAAEEPSIEADSTETECGQLEADDTKLQATSLSPEGHDRTANLSDAEQTCDETVEAQKESQHDDDPSVFRRVDFAISDNISDIRSSPGEATSQQEEQGGLEVQWNEEPLDVCLDAFSEFSPEVRLAAGLILARASAHVLTAEDACKWSLLTSVAEKEERKAEQDILTADLERRRARVSELQDELSSVRKSFLDVQRKFKGRLVDAEDRENSLKFHAINLERNVVEACEQLKLHDEKHIKVIQELQRELVKSNSRASSLEREFVQFRNDKLVETAQVQNELDSMRIDIEAKDALVSKLKSERDEAIRGWESEATRRIQAEDSERLALDTAASQAELTTELRSALVKSRSLGLRVFSSQAKVLPAELRNAPAQEIVRSQDPLCSPVECTLLPSYHHNTTCPDTEMPAKNRASQHKILRRQITQDRKFLAETIQNQKQKAKSTLEMEKNQVMRLQQSAPDALKALGFAFRVYMMPNGRDRFAARVAGVLSIDYSVFVDPSSGNHPQGDDLENFEEAVAFAGLSHTVLFFATHGSLSNPRCKHELTSARQNGSAILFVVQSGVGIADLGCTDKALLSNAVEPFWNWRIADDSDEICVVEKVKKIVGIPDCVLNRFPSQALLSMKENSAMKHQSELSISGVDLVHLNMLVDLEINWNQEGHQSNGKENECISLEEPLCQIIRHNKTLRNLKIGGCPTPAAHRFGKLLVSTKPYLKTFTINVAVPVSKLLGTDSSQTETWRIEGELLRSADVALISELIPHCKSLKDLSVGEAPKLSQSEVEMFGTSIQALMGLKRFNDADLRPFSEGKVGTHIDFSGKHLGYLGMLILAGAWRRTSDRMELECINLNGCGIGRHGVSVLASCVDTSDTMQLKSILMDGNSDGGAAYLAESLKYLENLHVLRLGRNKVGGEGAQKLASALGHCKMLGEVSFEGNFVGDIGSLALGETFGQEGFAGGLKLILRDNFNVGAAGAKALGKALMTSSTLQVVDLAKNHLGSDGCKHIALAIQKNTSLVELNVASCKLRAEGAEHLAEALSKNSTLQVLDVSRNTIGDRGASALAAALHTSTSLKARKSACIDLPLNSSLLVLLSSVSVQRNRCSFS